VPACVKRERGEGKAGRWEREKDEVISSRDLRG
jgi:hypothetical protein